MFKPYACLTLLAAALAFSGCSHKGTKATTETSVTTTRADSTHEAAEGEPGKKTAPPGEAVSHIWTDVYFAYDDASLNDDAKSTLSSHGSYLSKHPQHVTLEGNCDERGSVEYSLALGE